MQWIDCKMKSYERSHTGRDVSTDSTLKARTRTNDSARKANTRTKDSTLEARTGVKGLLSTRPRLGQRIQP